VGISLSYLIVDSKLVGCEDVYSFHFIRDYESISLSRSMYCNDMKETTKKRSKISDLQSGPTPARTRISLLTRLGPKPFQAGPCSLVTPLH
jgi:hypothetical protein